MSYLKSFPAAIRSKSWVLQAIARLWFTDKFHPESCKCEGCFLGVLQQELKLDRS